MNVASTRTTRRLKRSYREWRRRPALLMAQDVGLILLALGVLVIAYAALGAA